MQQVPSKNKIVIGQIHSKDEAGSQNDPLLKLQYHYKDGTGRVEALLRKRPGDKEVENILLAENVDIGERFGYDLRLTPAGAWASPSPARATTAACSASSAGTGATSSCTSRPAPISRTTAARATKAAG